MRTSEARNVSDAAIRISDGNCGWWNEIRVGGDLLVVEGRRYPGGEGKGQRAAMGRRMASDRWQRESRCERA
jgi:hypothetical protein